MKIKKETLPPVYAIWAQSRPDSPLQGRSGFLLEDGQPLQFPSQQAAKQKIQDLENLRLCRVPTAAYRCVAYPGGGDTGPGIALEQIKAHDLRPDFGPMDYEIIQRIYGDTGGGCMVGTLAVWLTGLDKTVWINCSNEGVTVTASDYVWNEDDSGNWKRYEDVVLREINFWDHTPEDLGPLLPAVQEAVAFTVGRELEHSSRLLRLPVKWVPEVFRQTVDPEYLKWAAANEYAVEFGRDGVVVNGPDDPLLSALRKNVPGKVVYIASPLSGDVEQNLQFARQACRYAISEDVVPFAPHLLYTQMLDDSDLGERQLGIDMGNRMLMLCDELWLCGDRISPGMAGEKELAEHLGLPVRSVSAKEIQSVAFSHTEGMEMTMG